MAGIFETFVRGWRLGFNGPQFRAFMGGLAAVMDKADVLARQATREGYGGLAEDDKSLGLIGADYGIPSAPSMTTEEYRDLLAYKVPLNQLRGTGLGLCLGLHFADFPGAVVVQQNGIAYQITGTVDLADIVEPIALPSWITMSTLSDSNPNIPASTDGKPAIAAGTIPWWTIDGGMDAEGNQWNGRFMVLFPSDVDDPALGTAANLARIRRVIRAWRPAKARCAGIVVCTSGKLVGWPPRDVADGGTVGPGSATTYTAE